MDRQSGTPRLLKRFALKLGGAPTPANLLTMSCTRAMRSGRACSTECSCICRRRLNLRERHDHGQRIRAAFEWVNAAEHVASDKGEGLKVFLPSPPRIPKSPSRASRVS